MNSYFWSELLPPGVTIGLIGSPEYDGIFKIGHTPFHRKKGFFGLNLLCNLILPSKIVLHSLGGPTENLKTIQIL
jgi:hypothetical protein